MWRGKQHSVHHGGLRRQCGGGDAVQQVKRALPAPGRQVAPPPRVPRLTSAPMRASRYSCVASAASWAAPPPIEYPATQVSGGAAAPTTRSSSIDAIVGQTCRVGWGGRGTGAGCGWRGAAAARGGSRLCSIARAHLLKELRDAPGDADVAKRCRPRGLRQGGGRPAAGRVAGCLLRPAAPKVQSAQPLSHGSQAVHLIKCKVQYVVKVCCGGPKQKHELVGGVVLNHIHQRQRRAGALLGFDPAAVGGELADRPPSAR